MMPCWPPAGTPLHTPSERPVGISLERCEPGSLPGRDHRHPSFLGPSPCAPTRAREQQQQAQARPTGAGPGRAREACVLA